jgi:3-oxoadipate enol-lactonase
MKIEMIIESFDFKIYIKVEGTGKPIVLLHSLWGDSALFDNFAEKLTNSYRIVRIDFPGHGNSPSPSKNFSFKEFSGVINDVLDKIGIIGKVSLIGHSMGGFAALAYANAYVEKTASLVLMHSLVRDADHRSIKLRERQARLINQDKKELMLQITGSSNFAPGNAVKHAREFEQLIRSANRTTKEGALAGIHAINSRENSLPFMMKSKIPTLIIVGKHDRIYNPEDQLFEHSNIPHAELLTLLNSGHLGFMEEGDIVAPKVKEFLRSAQT